ncbi:MAG TPA: hypothetical protein PLG04_10590, partial [Anaerolineaceae bacterium]|nr:hypothetical protein [Anaerolineaceae bacterium]
MEEKNLVTIHNLSGDKLQKVFRMGGLPMPSLAVLDIEKGGHDQFGEVSLIGGEDILSASRKSPVYMADAWTPQYPDVVYQINPGQQETIKAITKIVNGINKDWKAVEELEVEQNIQKHGLEKALYLAFKRAYGREGWNPGRTAEDYREIERKSTSKARQIAKKYPVQTTEAIRTGFNINGNRKYRPHTLDNVVKEMERQKKVNDGTPTGLNELIGRMSPAMNSINSVKKNRDRILSNKEYQEARAKLEQEFDALVEYAKEHRKSDWWWYEPMQVMSDIYDIFNGRYSQIKQDYDGETDFGKFREVINRIRTLPTDYFEGKPRRVVAINEFAGAVIPTNADKGLAKSLKDAGLKVYKYEAGDSESRFEVTKKASEELG